MINANYEPLFTDLARRHLVEMDEADSDYERNTAALSAMMAIISGLPDNGAFETIVSMLAHVTIGQPDPASAMAVILEGIQAGWDAIAQSNSRVTVQ